jgi:hypothetical protein
VLTLALAALAPCTLLLVAHSCSSGELQSHSAPIFDACPDGSELKLALFGTLDVSLFAHFPLGPFLVNLACLAACSAAGLAQLYRDRGANRMVDQQIRDLVKCFAFEGDAVTYKTAFTEPKSPPLGARVYRALWLAGPPPEDGLRLRSSPLAKKPPPATKGMFARSGKKATERGVLSMI